MEIYIAVQWLLFVVVGSFIFDQNGRSCMVLVALMGMVLAISLFQWFFVPVLIGLRRADLDEKVNISRSRR
jgi:hypothetical protein